TNIGGPGGLVYNPAAVSTLTLGGTNSYAGGTTGNANARYVLTAPSGFGTGPVTLTNTTSTTFNVPSVGFNFGTGGSATVNNPISALTLQTAALPPQGTLRLDAAGIDVSRAVTVLGSSGVNTNGFNGTLSGVVAGTGALTKTGAGTLTLTNTANTHTGAVAVN